MSKSKVTFKEKYGTVGHFLKGDNPCNYLGDLLIEGTTFYRHREWRGVVDTAYAFGQWLMTWGRMSSLVLRDPVRMVRAFWRYRWLSAYLGAPMMVDKWLEGDRGMTLRADSHAVAAMIGDTVDILWKQLRADRNFGETKWSKKTIPFDYTLPKHIMYGFPGYIAINIQQQAAFMVPILNKNLGSYYVDQAVSCGIPGDMCTLPLTEVGVAVENEYPDIGDFWLCSNNPCDANMMDNLVMWRNISQNGKKAVHPFVSPLMYDDPTCKELGVHEVYEAIAFIEEQTGQKFNWDTFTEALEEVNQLTYEELDRWDVYAKTDNGPLNPVIQGFFRIYMYQQSASKYFVKQSKKINKIFAKCVQKNIKPFPNTRHRALAWSCGSTYYSYGVQWLYNCWGILTVINMDSLTGHNIVDTDDRETMMSDVADWYARTPMRTHTVGGNRHLMQMWETAEKFNCDMIIMYDDVGCKGMAGAQGLIEEETRKHSDRFHVVWMPHALMDHRIVSRAQARKTVNDYMINVMHEEPVDPTLVDFDDTIGW